MGRKKKSLLMLGLVLAVLMAALATVVGLSRHVPEFYSEAVVAAGEKRKEWASTFMAKFVDLGNCFKDGVEERKPIVFLADEINSFFKEDFWRKDADGLEAQGIDDPRVGFDKDRLRLAFRYKNFFMTTIISLEMRLWLVPTEMNTFAVEILNRRAGALPFPTQALLEEISGMARKRKIEVNWYRHNGHPVALVRVQTNSPRPVVKFEHLDLQPGKLTLVMVPNELAAAGQAQGGPPRAVLPPGVDPRKLSQQASPTE